MNKNHFILSQNENENTKEWNSIISANSAIFYHFQITFISIKNISNLCYSMMVKESHFCHENNNTNCHYHYLCFSIFVLFNFVSNITENYLIRRINNTNWVIFHLFHSFSVEEWKSIWELRMKLSNGRTRWYEMILKIPFISTFQLES